jgi:IS30 family transposase
MVVGLSLRAIARQLDRAPSTISREINRNSGLKRYRAIQADKAAWNRAHRPKPCKLAGNLQLSRIIASNPVPLVARADCWLVKEGSCR